MNKLQNIKLFKDLNEASYKYINLNLKDSEIDDNKKIQELICKNKSNIDNIKKRINFISKETLEKAKHSNLNEIYLASIELNRFASNKYNEIIKSNIDIESTPVKVVLLTTIEELDLINKSIKNKEYIKDKNTYFYIYDKTIINAFVNFLVLKDFESVEKTKIEKLSQAILSQIQTLSLISI